MKFHILLVLLLTVLLATGCTCSDDHDDDDDAVDNDDVVDDDDAVDDDDDDQTDDDADDDDSASDDDISDDDDDAVTDDDDDSSDDDDIILEDTWADPATGLTWQVKPPSEGMLWEEAKLYCQELSLEGTGWRLPTISELRSVVRGCEATMTGGACNVTDECTSGGACWSEICLGCEFLEGPSDGCYNPAELGMWGHSCWSSTKEGFSGAWYIDFTSGWLDLGDIERAC